VIEFLADSLIDAFVNAAMKRLTEMSYVALQNSSDQVNRSKTIVFSCLLSFVFIGCL